MNSFSQKSLAFVWCPDLLNSRSSLFSERDGEGVEIVRVYGMGSTRISAFIERSELADVDGLEADDKCSESNRSDWSDCFNHSDHDVTISIIDDCVLSEAIECAWVYIHTEICSITISIFNAELVHGDFSSKFQNLFSEIIQFFVEIILFIAGSNILYISFELS